MSGTLFICGLPIGNPNDISARVIETLTLVDLIAAEDTRSAGLLLSQWKIKKPLIAYHDFSDESRRQEIITKLLENQNIALISDAGMPTISDPGYHLVNALTKQNIPVVVIPGPTALITALAASGLPSDRFCFEGFLPRAPKQRQEQLESLQKEQRTLIFYEAPHRLLESLEDILLIFGDRKCFAARELTKKYEEYFRGTISEIKKQLTVKEPRGEFVLIVSGAEKTKNDTSSEEQNKLLEILKDKNISSADCIEILAKYFSLNKNQLKKQLYHK